ncbi:MAG: hypothetical protein M1813_007571 [Trichoglossum hirsutum]|nr:MAG: hypothetical protein M1813_007571 [Trichoglossum hirsutum]
MCHYTLHIHTCGDSYFTKYSSCSFDRAAHHPQSALNPLHPFARPSLPHHNPQLLHYHPSLPNSPAALGRPAAAAAGLPAAYSNFQTLEGGEAAKCYVFEVVLQNREPDDCPACARSPRRRRLPARARGIYALS